MPLDMVGPTIDFTVGADQSRSIAEHMNTEL